MMKKGGWALLLILSVVLLLAGCGTSSQGAKQSGETPDQSKAQGSDQSQAKGNEKTDSGDKSKVVKVGITQIVEHPSLDAAREGFIKALEDNGFNDGKTMELDYQNAQGDATNNQTIAQKFVSDKKDLVLAIATPSAQALVNATSDIPILFTAITDPIGAKLVDDLDKPGKNVTGTSDTHPEAISKLMAFIHDEFPKTKKMGIIYNAGEQNSVVNVESAKKELDKYGITAVEATISNSSEVKQAAESLIGRCDVIYVPKDNTVVSALVAVLEVGASKKVPVFAGETDSVKAGALASYGLDYNKLGYKTGMMAVDILKNGKKPGDMAVGYPDEINLMINADAAKKMGVTITDSMRKKAEQVINE